MKVEEPTVDDQGSDDDDISEPDEDTLDGQMAAMRGGFSEKFSFRGVMMNFKSSTDNDKAKLAVLVIATVIDYLFFVVVLYLLLSLHTK